VEERKKCKFVLNLIREDKNDYNKKIKEVSENNKSRAAKANHMNEHISNIYKIYAPYVKQSPVKYNKYTIDKKNLNGNNLKSIDKYYDYYNIYKPKKNVIELGQKVNIVPNRKLSPILRKDVI
jgi:hypothetical protein